MELSIRLAEIFLDNPGGVYSIHQISKKIEIPYGTAYNRIHQLGETGIVRIIPQGKAKLCSLNPENPMTATLLGMGAAKGTAEFYRKATPFSQIVIKFKDFLEAKYRDVLHSCILLNLDTLNEIDFSQPMIGSDAIPEESVTRSDNPAELTAGAEEAMALPLEAGPLVPSLDFFLVMADESIEINDLETMLMSVVPAHFHPRITRMIVSPSTLFGMLQEKENDAGVAAYHMLRKGLILSGFDNFFRLILIAMGRASIRA